MVHNTHVFLVSTTFEWVFKHVRIDFKEIGVKVLLKVASCSVLFREGLDGTQNEQTITGPLISWMGTGGLLRRHELTTRRLTIKNFYLGPFWQF